jgi:hypothetical protein
MRLPIASITTDQEIRNECRACSPTLSGMPSCSPAGAYGTAVALPHFGGGRFFKPQATRPACPWPNLVDTFTAAVRSWIGSVRLVGLQHGRRPRPVAVKVSRRSRPPTSRYDPNGMRCAAPAQGSASH